MDILKNMKIFHRKARSESAINVNWPRTDLNFNDDSEQTSTPSRPPDSSRLDASHSVPSAPPTSLLAPCPAKPDIFTVRERIAYLETHNARLRDEALLAAAVRKRGFGDGATSETRIQFLQRQLTEREASLKERVGPALSEPIISAIIDALSDGRPPDEALLLFIQGECIRESKPSPWRLLLVNPPLTGSRLPTHIKSHILIWHAATRRQESYEAKLIYWSTEAHKLTHDILAPSLPSVPSILDTLIPERQEALEALIESRRGMLTTVVASDTDALPELRLTALIASGSAASTLSISRDSLCTLITTPGQQLHASDSTGTVNILVTDVYSGIASDPSFVDSVYSGICGGSVGSSSSTDVFLSVPPLNIPRRSGSRCNLMQVANLQLGSIAEENTNGSREQEALPNPTAATSRSESLLITPVISATVQSGTSTTSTTLTKSRAGPSSQLAILSSNSNPPSLMISPPNTPTTRSLIPTHSNRLTSARLAPPSPPSPSRLPVLRTRSSWEVRLRRAMDVA